MPLITRIVPAWIDIIQKAPVLPKSPRINKEMNGGFMVAGLYVSKTTRQVEGLEFQCGQIL